VSGSPLTLFVAHLGNVLGAEHFYLLALPLVYWCVDKRVGRRLALLFVLAAGSTAMLKHAIGRARPTAHQLLPETSPSMPSGHATNTAALGTCLAARLRRPAVTWALAGIVVFVGVSRVVAGVHWPSDVLAGWLLGALLGALWTKVRAPMPGPAAALAMAAVAAGLGLAVAAMTPHPAEALRDVAGPAGAGLGLALGFALEARALRFRADGGRRGRRLVVGLLVLFALYLGLAVVLHGWAGRLVRYAAVGLWASAGAPWLFVRLGWAETETAAG
jgi:glycerophosphoryl diester phosphodiesterase